MTIFRLAHYRIRPEAAAACQAAVQDIVQSVQASEPGTLQYTVVQDHTDPLRWLHCSVYQDQAAFESHLKNATMLERIRAVLEPAMTAPAQFETYEVLASTPLLKVSP